MLTATAALSAAADAVSPDNGIGAASGGELPGRGRFGVALPGLGRGCKWCEAVTVPRSAADEIVLLALSTRAESQLALIGAGVLVLGQGNETSRKSQKI